MDKWNEVFDGLSLRENLGVDYLLLPGTRVRPSIIDWQCVRSVLFSRGEYVKEHIDCSLPNGCSHAVQTKNSVVCTCMIQNSLVYTPHNGSLYYITGVLDELNGNSLLRLSEDKVLTYKNYFEARYVLLLDKYLEKFSYDTWTSVQYQKYKKNKWIQKMDCI